MINDVSGRHRRRWLSAGVTGWAVLLLGLTYVSVGRDEPTVREQRSVAEAAPIVSRAMGELVAAAGPDVVVELSPVRLDPSCRITFMRDGATLEQSVTFRTTDAEAPALLDRIAQRLPSRYQASARHSKGGTVHKLWADAGEFVEVRGGVTQPGMITVTAATGCRPQSPDFAANADLLQGLPNAGDPAQLLAALGASAVETGSAATASCPGVGAVYTARAVGRQAAPEEIGAALRPRIGADAVVIVDRPGTYAYRSGPMSVVIEAADGELRAAVTSGCVAAD